MKLPLCSKLPKETTSNKEGEGHEWFAPRYMYYNPRVGLTCY